MSILKSIHNSFVPIHKEGYPFIVAFLLFRSFLVGYGILFFGVVLFLLYGVYIFSVIQIVWSL